MVLKPDHLTPILPLQAGVCSLCRGWSPWSDMCEKCRVGSSLFDGIGEVPKVLPLALAVPWNALAERLWNYKHSGSVGEQSVYSEDLAGIVARYAYRHLGCLQRAAGIRQFDSVTWVPSGTAREGAHPLQRVLSMSGHPFATYAEDLLDATVSGPNDRRFDRRRFRARPSSSGHSVLLVDDTWTSGSSALSAAASLLSAGAPEVAILVLGRWFKPDWSEGHRYLSCATSLGFDVGSCTYCDQRPASVGDGRLLAHPG